MNDRRLRLGAVHRRSLSSAAAAALPEECCGVLLGRRSGAETVVESVVAARNVSPDDRRASYVIDPEAIVEARRRGLENCSTIVGFYHSHPDGTDRPSARDQQEAWPDTSYVIVSPAGGLTSWRAQPTGPLRRESIVEVPTEALASGAWAR